MDIDVANHRDAIKTAVWGITRAGARLGEKISSRIEGSHCFVLKKYGSNLIERNAVTFFESLSSAIKTNFKQFDAHVFIFSTGIAVRMIAPLIRTKLEDPAVVVLDEKGDHVISLLSGHIGGANALSEKIAEMTGGTAVITTATDKNALPAIDMIAKDLSLVIETPENIKRINSAFLDGREIKIHDDTEILFAALKEYRAVPCDPDKTGETDIYCSWKTHPVSRETLVLRPRWLYVGMGCNRGTSEEDLEQFLRQVFAAERLSPDAISQIGTTDVKTDETGLTLLGENLSVPIRYYSKDQLNSVKTEQAPSAMTLKHLGVNSVCEAAALLGAKRGKLIVTKKKNRDVTIAVAIEK